MFQKIEPCHKLTANAILYEINQAYCHFKLANPLFFLLLFKVYSYRMMDENSLQNSS